MQWFFNLISTAMGKTNIICGGSIISDRYILTAAHCAAKASKKWNLESVRIGDWDLDTEIECDPDNTTDCLPAPIDIGIEETVVHVGYNKTKISSPHDIALIRLTEKIDLSGLVKPICLPYESSLWEKNYTGQYFTTTGWGWFWNQFHLIFLADGSIFRLNWKWQNQQH